MSRHCRCALVLGPAVERKGRCGRRECGGLESEAGGMVAREEVRRRMKGGEMRRRRRRMTRWEYELMV
jgi:hypothetical protein